jgi:hypothetical protein
VQEGHALSHVAGEGHFVGGDQHRGARESEFTKELENVTNERRVKG